MTGFHYAQIALATCAAVIGARRVRVLLFRANLDAGPFLDALRERLAADLDAARALCRAAEPAWVARLALAELRERADRGGASRGLALELAGDLREEAALGIRALRTLGRAASPLAFVGVMVELGLAFQHQRGLLALQKGLVEQRAMQNAVVGVTLGLVTSLCCYVTASLLLVSARRRIRELARVSQLFEGSDEGQNNPSLTAIVSRAET